MPRYLKRQVTLVNASQEAEEVQRLHQRLDEALMYLGEIQHTPYGTDSVGERQRAQAALFLAVEDLVCALLGPRAKVTREP